MAPCVVAHPKQRLKQDVCPRLDPEKSSVEEVLAGFTFWIARNFEGAFDHLLATYQAQSTIDEEVM